MIDGRNPIETTVLFENYTGGGRIAIFIDEKFEIFRDFEFRFSFIK